MLRPILMSIALLGLTNAASTALSAQSRDKPPAVIMEGDGTNTFVLITGMVGGVAGFAQLDSLLLARGYRVLRIDPYELSLDSMDVSFAAMARRVDAAMARYGVRKARIVAHSHGAGVALRLAASYPDRVEAMYLLDSGALPCNGGPTLSASLRFVPLITRFPGGRGLVRDRFVDGLKRSSGRSEWLTPERQQTYTTPVLNDIDRVVAMAFRLARSAEPESLVVVVGRVHAPTMVIVGAAPHEADMGRQEIEALAPLGALVHITRLPAVGHFPHEEAPNDLLPLLIAPLPPPAVRLAHADDGQR